MGVGFMYNQQMLNLFAWIRDYNSGKDNEEKVRIYGCDMRAPQKTAMKLIQCLQSVGVRDIDLEEKLTWLSKRLPRNTLNLEEKDTLLAKVKKLRSFSTLFEVGFERKKYELHTRLIEQYVNYNTSKNAMLLREEYMAENCFSIIGLEEGKKAIVSSHNVHIAEESGFYGHATMGKYISERLRGNYYCLATSFAKGSFRAVDMNEQKKAIIHFDAPHKKSHDLLFSNCRYPNFFLDFNSLSETELRIELSKAKDFWSIGEAYFSLKRSAVKQSLTNNYDGIIFIQETSPPSQLSWDLIDRQF